MNNNDLNQLSEFKKFFFNSSVDISLASFILSIIISAILAYLIKITYIQNSQTLSNKSYFSDQFIPLATITCLVITVIKFSLALSLGLVGALSIVRFRTPIKEPEELVYLFFVIGIGLACGANQYIIAIFATLLIVGIIFFLRLTRVKESKSKSNYSEINVIQINIKNNQELIKINEILEKIKNHTNFIKLKSSFINQIESTYIIWADFKDQNSYLDLVEYTSKLSKENKSLEFSFTTSDNIYE